MRLRESAQWKDQKGAVALEAAFVLSMILLCLIVVVDLTSVVYAKLRLSAAVHAGSAYTMTGYSIREGDPFPDVPEIAVAEHAAFSEAHLYLTHGQCNVCYGGEENVTCVKPDEACAGRILFTMDTITANYAVPLVLSYPRLANPFSIGETIYYPSVTNVRADENSDKNF